MADGVDTTGTGYTQVFVAADVGKATSRVAGTTSSSFGGWYLVLGTAPTHELGFELRPIR